MAKKVLLKVASGDPVKPIVENDMVLTAKEPLRSDFDLRDTLSGLVGKGNTLSPDDKAAIYGSLVASLGKDKAQKVMNHAYIFNSRPDVQKLPVEEKLRAFYAIGSNDPDVKNVMGRTKNLGYGVIPGARESANYLSSQIYGDKNVGGQPINTSVVPEIGKKVMLRIGK